MNQKVLVQHGERLFFVCSFLRMGFQVSEVSDSRISNFDAISKFDIAVFDALIVGPSQMIKQ